MQKILNNAEDVSKQKIEKSKIFLFILQLSQSILVLTKIEETIVSFMCIICELSYMYYMNYMSQQVLDCSNNIIITM